jgi:hypothetical protein
MDPTTSAGLGIGGIVAGVLGVLYTYMKHSKCKLNWCGKQVDFSVDLTPIKIPEDKIFHPVDGSGTDKDKDTASEKGTNGKAKGGDE